MLLDQRPFINWLFRRYEEVRKNMVVVWVNVVVLFPTNEVEIKVIPSSIVEASMEYGIRASTSGYSFQWTVTSLSISLSKFIYDFFLSMSRKNSAIRHLLRQDHFTFTQRRNRMLVHVPSYVLPWAMGFRRFLVLPFLLVAL